MDAADPDTFITGVAAVLSDYPPEVVSRVTDPRTGLPGKQAFPPSPFEVKTACEAEMAPIYRQRERDRRAREAQAASRMIEGPRPTFDEMQARGGGPGWGLAPVARREPELTEDEMKEAAERFAVQVGEEMRTNPPALSNALRRKLNLPNDVPHLAAE